MAGEQVVYAERPEKTLKWTGTKILIALLLFILSFTCIVLGLKPLIEGDNDLKAFVNILFVVFHFFYMFSFTAVKKTTHFFFWSLSFFMIDGMTLVFLFYDEIFF
ncbi:hypothetical protein H311_02582 [Anncaliia algerae PRA109]|uniref:Leptin receptor n=1 Tax=Anncaliia algerae PRA339 TaxID=1288291 RepID=A0A059F4M2_9MICR|nr:hypothetical protein H311_02691 [Anncaliia algerae PRA109]KCZ76421.1 hypothetical protein H311_02582 [Anncaliia algerae PRA109]KCZ82233.1 hypothetical protein H312_00256 [Anncaliia algerae PRA339]